jgi:hypothetical protein
LTQAHIWESTRDRAAAFRRRTVRAACAGATAVALVVGGFAAPAFADEYPSWEDVKAAQSTEAAQAALVAQIKADLQALQEEVASATALVEKRGQEYFDAQQTFDDKTFEAGELQRQADEALRRRRVQAPGRPPRVAARPHGGWEPERQPLRER